jgi:hypothetical protein
MDEQSAEALGAALAALDTASEPYGVGHYPNFVEEPANVRGFFDAETWARLREVKARYDAADMFRANHHIAPAAAATAMIERRAA